VTKRASWTLCTLAAVLALAVLLRLLLGPGGLSFPRGGTEWTLRGQRVLSGLTVGAALAVGGVMLQALLRNPLASPDLIGPAAGAGLAVTVAAWLGTFFIAADVAGNPVHPWWWGGLAHAPSAMIGALLTLGVVYALSQRRGFVEPVSLILIGVIVSIVCGAATLFFAHLMPPHVRFEISRWTVGAISDDVPISMLAVAGALTVAGVALAAWRGESMDVASLSEDEARTSGVAVGGLRVVLFLAAGALTAMAVVLAGPVGFVGLVAPHVVRLIAGPSHKVLAIGAALAGASLVVLADSAVRALDFGAGRMPLGVVTALVGGPVFLLLLRREMRSMMRGY
jgi:iron complex transport system permease protein